MYSKGPGIYSGRKGSEVIKLRTFRIESLNVPRDAEYRSDERKEIRNKLAYHDGEHIPNRQAFKNAVLAPVDEQHVEDVENARKNGTGEPPSPQIGDRLLPVH